VRELRRNASVNLAKVKAGETIEVTERDVLVALLQSPSPARSDRIGRSTSTPSRW
jgi:antitoxin (DNA-binding transcriptional repressor) of toxin-antitoxin stability system